MFHLFYWNWIKIKLILLFFFWKLVFLWNINQFHKTHLHWNSKYSRELFCFPHLTIIKMEKNNFHLIWVKKANWKIFSLNEPVYWMTNTNRSLFLLEIHLRRNKLNWFRRLFDYWRLKAIWNESTVRFNSFILKDKRFEKLCR